MALPTTYDEAEKSDRYGSPMELFVFSSNGESWYYSSAEVDTLFNYDGDSYTPELYPISRTEIEETQEDRTGAIDVTVPQDNPIAQMFVGTIPVSPISLIILRRHRTENEDAICIFSGKVAGVTFKDGTAVLACLPLSALLRKGIPWPVYQSQCNWALYGIRCGLDAEDYATESVVNYVFLGPYGHGLGSPEISASDEGYYLGGFVRRELNGDVKWIANHWSGYIYLMSPFRNPPMDSGETVTLYAGCDRQHTTCLGKFDNLDNFMGMPFVPLKNPYSGPVK